MIFLDSYTHRIFGYEAHILVTKLRLRNPAFEAPASIQSLTGAPARSVSVQGGEAPSVMVPESGLYVARVSMSRKIGIDIYVVAPDRAIIGKSG